MTPDLLSVKGHSLALEYDLTDTIQLRSLTGLRSLAEITGGNDIDGNALRDPLGFFGGAPGDTFTFISSIQDREQKQFSEELQVLGEHGPIEWLAGVYFFRETGDDKNPVWIFQDFPGDVALPGLFPPPVSNHADVTNKSKALFAHATYHALENLYVSVGLRQTWDDRKMFDRVIPGRKAKGSFDSFDWSIKLGFDPIEDVNLYASVVTGYLSGGFLNGAPFKEEDVISYEIGAKTRWLDRRLTLNGDVFFMDYEDLQLPVFTGFLSLFNAGKAEIFGAELEANLELVEGVNLNLGWGYQDFEYKELRFGVGAPDVSSTAQRTNTPPHTLNLGAGYTAPERTFGTLSFGFDASWRDDVKFLLFAHPDPVTNRAATQNAHWQLAARAALSEIPLAGITGKENMRGKISIWALNLTNEDEIQFASDLGSVVVGKFMKPRTFGIDFTLDF
jgi:iron complex outermembrane receptor protein